MTNWKEYKLGEIITHKKGNAFKSKDYISKGRRIVRVSNLTDSSIDAKDCNCIDEKLANEYLDYELKQFDIIIATVGSWQSNPASVVGKVISVPENCSGFLLNQNAVRLRSNDKSLQRFLYYLLKDKKFFNHIIAGARGSANQASITLEQIFSFSFNLPDLPTQTAIAEILSSLDDKIELNNKINQELENLAQTLFKQWFIDFEFPNENGEPYKSSGGEMVESELGEIPKGWEVGSIYDVSDVIYGAPFKSKLFNQENKGLPLIRIRDLKTFQPQNWTEEIHPKGTKIVAGDLVVGMDAEFRPHFWLGQPAWLNQRLCHFRPKKGFSKLFIREIIRPQLAFHENSSVGTTVIHLGKGDIDTFKSLIPVNPILIQFEELSNSIFDSIICNSKENQELTNLRDTLLPKLISGELEVAEVNGQN